MKYKFLLTISFILPIIAANAQKQAKAYAITGKASNRFVWTEIKQIDINTGKIIGSLFEADKTPYKTTLLDKSAPVTANAASPAGFGVAACAFDAAHNRLYFAPMHFSEISFVELDKKELLFTTIKKNILPVAANQFVAEENQFSRMVIAADGFGYALTNDANHLLRFSTGRQPVVQDLGSLLDADSNKGFSVHNKCSSWGGDMLADAFGNLVVISANHSVYTIDVKTRVATYTGSITGLPANYTTNGALVNDAGDIIVSSANVFEGLYQVNYKDLKATKLAAEVDKTFNASDLANANLLLQKEADAATKFDVSKSALPALPLSADAKVFPNPVTGGQFSLYFGAQKPGRYTIQLTDLAGRALQAKVINLSAGKQVEDIRFAGKIANGTYLVKVVDAKAQLMFTERVVVQ
ncbi:MAG: hypothetical protein RL172_959 [Bacteroidota bacterium]